MASIFDPKYGSAQSSRKSSGCASFLADKCEADNANYESDEMYRRTGIFPPYTGSYEKQRAYRQYDSADGMNFCFDE